MQLKQINIEQLKFDQNNIRQHSFQNIQMIKNSLKQFGQYKPLIVDEQTMIVKVGNGRLEAMKSLGYQKCWCVLMKTGDDLAVIDNRLNQLSDWNDKEISDWLLEQKGLDWWGIDVDLSKELIKLKNFKEKKEVNKKQLNKQKQEILCPCCGKPLKKKDVFIIS